MMMMMTSLRRRWSRQVGQSSNRRCQPSRQAHVKPPFWQIKYLLAFLLSFLSGYDDLAMHIGNTLFHNFCNLLFLLGPGLAFGWLGLGGSSGGYSSHGYTSHASLRAFGAQLEGDRLCFRRLTKHFWDNLFQTGPVDNNRDTLEQ